MKVALNPAELRLIVDALDDKRQFQLQSGRAGGAGKRGLRTLLHLQRPKRFRIVSERSTQELVPKNDCSRGGCIPFPAKKRNLELRAARLRKSPGTFSRPWPLN